MTTETNLTEAREELRQQLAGGVGTSRPST